LPRLYFPEQPEQPQFPERPDQPHAPPSRPYGQPLTPGQPQNQSRGAMFKRRPAQRSAGKRPARQRSTQPPDRELRQRAIAALIFGALSLVAPAGIRGNPHRGVYLLIFSAIVGVAACVIGITALRKARRTGSYRPRGAVGGIVLGAFAALISIPTLAFYLAFPTQVNNYVRCLSVAQSSSEQHACISQFYKSVRPSTSGPGHQPGGSAVGPARRSDVR
jgi:hypothetical protein